MHLLRHDGPALPVHAITAQCSACASGSNCGLLGRGIKEQALKVSIPRIDPAYHCPTALRAGCWAMRLRSRRSR